MSIHEPNLLEFRNNALGLIMLYCNSALHPFSEIPHSTIKSNFFKELNMVERNSEADLQLQYRQVASQKIQ